MLNYSFTYDVRKMAFWKQVRLPDTDSEECLGGHAVVVVGYDCDRELWIMRNSWGGIQFFLQFFPATILMNVFVTCWINFEELFNPLF